MNNFEQTHEVFTYRSVLFPAPALGSTIVISLRKSSMVRKTYVYHESTKRTPSLSILLSFYSRRTMPQFH